MHESTDSMIHQVYDALKLDSWGGDFVVQSNTDRKELDIIFTDEEIAKRQ